MGVTTRATTVPDDAVDRAWRDLQRRFHAAGDRARVRRAETERGRAVRACLPRDVAPALAAVAEYTGGMLVDHGWFRLLGAGSAGMADLAEANGLPGTDTRAPGVPAPCAGTDAGAVGAGAPPSRPGFLLVGYDALGGRFAVDLGGLGAERGEVCYFGPDTLRWDGLGGSYTAFLHAVLDGAMGEVFGGLRWPGWEGEVEALPPGRALDVSPPLFTRAGHEYGASERRPVPAGDLAALFDALAADLDAPDDN